MKNADTGFIKHTAKDYDLDISTVAKAYEKAKDYDTFYTLLELVLILRRKNEKD